MQLPLRAQGGLATLGVREKVFSCLLLCVCVCVMVGVKVTVIVRDHKVEVVKGEGGDRRETLLATHNGYLSSLGWGSLPGDLVNTGCTTL